MDFIQEHLRTKKNVNFQDNQEQPNNIELDVLADTVYVKVTNAPGLLQTERNLSHYRYYFQFLK